MHKILVLIVVLTGSMTSYAQASMVPTGDAITQGSLRYSQTQLQAALDSQELSHQLSQMGVDATQLSDRIASLTPAEISQLNAELEQQPAGGIVGLLLTIFIVFVVTDMLCATDIFGFVKCINK